MKTETAFESNKTLHGLDNPIWEALSTLHAGFAQGDSLAKRYPVEVTSLAAMGAPTPEAFASLAKTLQRAGAALFLDQLPEIPTGWITIHVGQLAQMVCEKLPIAPEDFPAVELTAADVPEMVALAGLTQPGPFGVRTRELGQYLGVRQGNRLAAMAGERLHFRGYTEVSAVCTHPEFQGRGYAGGLMSVVMRGIAQRGETPLLHVRTENSGAIRLYEKLGFRTRRLIHFVVLRPR
ncbi:MAG: GNAT family N-acetyltransferase [Candidatus Acidiferrales bacterium]